MSRIVLSSKLLDVDVECDFLAELGDLMSDTEFPVDENWHAKIEMRPHSDAKVEVTYSMAYKAKKRLLHITEKTKGEKTHHPVDLPEDLEVVPVPFITDFLLGLPSALEYI